MLDAFFIFTDSRTLPLLPGIYQPWLVALSILVAIVTSVVTLFMAGLAARTLSRSQRQMALLSGALFQGIGIWAMHFVGMLAFDLCTSVRYDLPLTLLSILPAFCASWVTLNMLASPRVSRPQLLLGGLLVGAGIGGMHYTGMAAMQMAPILRYAPGWFVFSLLIAILLATLSLWIRFGLRQLARLGEGRTNLLAGCIMGFAIAGMHYSGMLSARFIGVAEPAGRVMAENGKMAAVVALLTLCAGVLVLAGNALLRYRQLAAEKSAGEARLQAVVDTAVDGIISMDARGRVLEMNRAAELMFGWQSAELVGRNINMLMPEPYRSGHDAYLAHYLQTGDARVIGVGREVSARRKDGSVFPIRLAVGRVDTGREPMFVGFVTDISERTAMERELKLRESQYRTLIDNMPGVAFRSRVDQDWSKIFISDSISELCGWPAASFVDGSISLLSIMHPDDVQRVRDTVSQAVRDRHSYVVEYRLFHMAGGERWVSESAGIVFDLDEQPQWLDGVMIDITDSRLRAAEYEGVVYAIRQALAVVEFDMSGHILTANDSFLALTGYRLDELQGRHHRVLCQPEEVASSAYQTFWSGLRAGQFQSGEFLRQGKDGRQVWIQAVYNPILDLDGKPCKVVKLASDVTDRKHMEQDLMAARDRAEQASAAKGMFLANMSHEIRTPMNAIIGFAQLLLDGNLQPEQRRHLQTINQSARALLGLLNGVLDTAKLERGALELDEADYALHELCQQLVDAFALQARDKQLVLQLDYAADCPDLLYGDVLRMRQILTNLLGNAVKFTEHGQVVLQVRCQADRLHISVSDSGIGIAPDRLDSIFAPFSQADASMARRFGGTGLGTTIARQLVELMGGSIGVRSQLGVGTTFDISLPLQAACGSQQPGTATPTLALPPLRVLAVDDVPENLELLQLMLQREGLQVTTAGGGAEAVALHADQRFDVVLMDVQMPEVDGLEATRQLRAQEAHSGQPPTPVIALTASVLSQDRKDAEAAGMNGFAVKPLDMASLRQEIARVTGLSGAVADVSRSNSQQLALIDWDGALARWGEREVLVERIRRFLADNQAQLAALADADAVSCRQQAHRLRGLAANLGLAQLQQQLAGVEQAAACSPAQAEAIDTIMAGLAAALPASGTALVTEVADSTAAPLPAAARPWLQRVMAACGQASLDDEAMQALAALLPAASLHALQAALDDFDFDAALQAAHALMPDAAGETEAP
ncbi:PAS domain S-box protein [Aquitalea sp. LB_tupeE]|uniref:PAS domain S-box protein n=1 Tax=Aquitalea sp. LB_tupeE TaxID=2748078 RepID=UPI0015C012F7|nr:PAS domain S-box protein [Aquitalea sp. LB_tupeE]NWK80110.1 PAS domain S-box protein [Aquitalea sp. LB_tupeE]